MLLSAARGLADARPQLGIAVTATNVCVTATKLDPSREYWLEQSSDLRQWKIVSESAGVTNAVFVLPFAGQRQVTATTGEFFRLETSGRVTK